MSKPKWGRRAFAICFGLLAVAGCAASAAPGTRDPGRVSIVTGQGATWEVQRGADIRVNQTVAATPDQAWTILPMVFEELGIAVDVRDPAARRLGASAHRFGSRFLNRSASDFFECGLDPGLNRPIAGQMPITARVVTEVMGRGEGAELRTVIDGVARRSGGNAGNAACRSTGLLEVLIGQMVQKMAAPPN